MSTTDATPSYNYLVHFSFAHPQSSLRPASQRWGNGSIPINTDKPIESDEEVKEVARTIGRLGGYEVVAVTSYDLTDKFIDDSAEIIEGLIVSE